MARKTQVEKVVEQLEEKGAVEVLPSRSRKYRQFSVPEQPGYYYFVGKMGAVRKGRTVSEARSLTYLFNPNVPLPR